MKTKKALHHGIAPACESSGVCGRFLTYPDLTGKRLAEGGLRTNEQYRYSIETKPLVSIITSVLNNKETLEKCILSVLDQTYENIEYIVIDAASSDGSIEILKCYADAIDYFISEPDNGIYMGMNKGLSLAIGEYIMILNADDWYDRVAVAKLVKKQKKSGSEIVAAHANVIDKNGRSKGINKSHWDSRAYISCALRQETMLVKKEVYDRLGPYDESKKIISDWLWILNAFENRVTVSILDKPLLFFQSDGLSDRSDDVHLKERKKALSNILNINNENTINLLMKPWILTDEQKAMLIDDHPGNYKLRNSLLAKKSMSYTPKVSVMVPVYNKDRYLKECLDSIINQTIKEIEIICVDDGSTDKSSEILKDYSLKDSRIKVVTHETNKGIIQARKSALIKAVGDFIAFVDADDLVEPEMLKALYVKAISENADFVQCNASIYDPKKILDPDIYRKYNEGMSNGKNCTFINKTIFKRYTWPIRVNLCLSFYKKDVYKKVIPYIKENAPKRGDDNLLSFFFMYFSTKYVFLNKILYQYRANETSSNLNKIDIELAKSQIKGRSESIKYAKWFAKQNGIEWNKNKMPFSAFTYSLVKYAASFIDRYIADGGKDKETLLHYFGDCFGGDGLLFYLKQISPTQLPSGTSDDLRRELNELYSSRSWKITKPLRWGISKIRGY